MNEYKLELVKRRGRKTWLYTCFISSNGDISDALRNFDDMPNHYADCTRWYVISIQLISDEVHALKDAYNKAIDKYIDENM